MRLSVKRRFCRLTQTPQWVDLVAGYDVSDQMTAIEDLMNQQAPMTTVLRAAVLLSLTAGGIRQKVLDNFKREFLQVSPVRSVGDLNRAHNLIMYHRSMAIIISHFSWHYPILISSASLPPETTPSRLFAKHYDSLLTTLMKKSLPISPIPTPAMLH
jgi:hypothetical protein